MEGTWSTVKDGLSLTVVLERDPHQERWIETLTGTRRIGGFRVTWRGFYPTWIGRVRVPLGLQLDHILLSLGIGVRHLETLPIPGSDHMAVKARIALPGP